MIETEPVERTLPYLLTHKEWCQWLASRGSLSPNHRMCTRNDKCMATHHGPVR